MGDCFSIVMSKLPVVESKDGKLFPSEKALAAVTSDAKSVCESKQQFDELSQAGKVKLYKQQITHMDRGTLKKVVEQIERDWSGSVVEFASFKKLFRSATDKWQYTENAAEELEISVDGKEILYFKIIRQGNENTTYNLAICHLCIATTSAHPNLVIGGMMAEGLLARDEEKNIYLQFS